ncbi:hypothetical protein CJP46_13200 [Paenibacillus sp. XY044]|nr:hypothetical protein CJP46_13200 [Paenibacillus sp. XY044]
MEEGRFASNYLDSPTKFAKQTELNMLRDSVFTQIIMGGDINKFDDFIKKWRPQSGDQILSELEAPFQKRAGKSSIERQQPLCRSGYSGTSERCLLFIHGGNSE